MVEHTLYVSAFGGKSQVRGYDISFPEGPTITISPKSAEELHRKLGAILSHSPAEAINAVE